VSPAVCVRIWLTAPSAAAKSAGITRSIASVVPRRSARRATRSMRVDRAAWLRKYVRNSPGAYRGLLCPDQKTNRGFRALSLKSAPALE